MSLRQSIICDLPGFTVVFFAHYLILEKEVYLNIKNVFLNFLMQFLSEIFLILGRIQRDTIKMYKGPRVKYPLFLSDFNENWYF